MKPERAWQRPLLSREPGWLSPLSNPLVERTVVALALAVTLSLSFHGLAWWNAHRWADHPERWNLALPIDSSIAFSPIWVWVYLSYFLVCASPVFCREMWEDLQLFRETAWGYALQFGLALPCFLLPFQMIRPELGPVSDWTGLAMSWVYRLDPGYNIFPSLHVSNTVFLACWMWRLRGWRPGAIYWVIAALITWSTLAVKQHYFIDLPAGLLLGVFCFRWCFRKLPTQPGLTGASRQVEPR
jgi:membrane-associated phospholipid phosphatase